MLADWNRWFDSLPKDRRFIVFLGYIAIPLGLTMGLLDHLYGPYIGVLPGLPFLAMRMWWLHRRVS